MIIQKLDGTNIDTSNYNLKRLFHYIPSANINHTLSSVEGRYDFLSNSKINNRIISVEFLYSSQDIYDYYLLRDELNALFLTEEEFYIIFKKEPYKRYLVKTNSQFQVPPNPHMQSFTVEFLTLQPYGESIFLTNEINSKVWDDGIYAWNNFIDWDIEFPPQYNHTEKEFTILNGGNVKIDPRNSFLEINLKGQGNNFSIINFTTGETYAYNSNLFLDDDFQIYGVRTFKNGVSDFKSTNKRLISLNPGINVFRINIDVLESISFSTRFLYK